MEKAHGSWRTNGKANEEQESPWRTGKLIKYVSCWRTGKYMKAHEEWGSSQR